MISSMYSVYIVCGFVSFMHEKGMNSEKEIFLSHNFWVIKSRSFMILFAVAALKEHNSNISLLNQLILVECHQ
ncbi:hypothetical protein C2G38_2098656 [Gigaspora rosea]|uniref:Uncharacterized protein n=1 Tax=Gigaspora rosea TaxID=44941 RepID=A0A397UVB2_9GLOM|nr:hypothetical protein C2G38_2098656 [Gigaspora rosea]